ncbi:bifunctional phosphopantothenoylcysteine decarboxylase/phosphopantothenate--cysteine ligase CoaBC [Bacillaceae bacterium SIJ1]|uniref:bifunctional phosphopantothenoylcysteine decarboxylase/phosphopantothenate--cysteine ligase CoaBC n=1 Tax=Litoribacterium kuwaitense TaxID=1398745 RepID=UPI0013EBBEFF|nr:bifunctional phosphopantothenoylcysteine decarboxylase/phosphopantothenate--cysteine ligase CoaBC [Litoribacterium kuwaitense]NGP44307.1 bifunctional phosphopantothenoylcysteine decarboxylase/phosphopantothenate--cysteine ligase CoaBC [Litoribacterium kuwaitense]
MKGKRIVLGVSGGIAAYKACNLASQLSQKGASVRVVMTDSAQKFVQPITFQALTRQPVYTDTFKEDHPEVVAHIDVADWADLVIVAPATANILAKMAHGIADDMLTTILLATSAPIWVAPAMNVHMYGHPAVQDNIETLFQRGVRFIEPDEGYLACGYVGKGRLEEPEKIVATISHFFADSSTQLLHGKKVLVTAGPTQEMLDPVRFFTNRSSGKMGYALAAEAARQGAEVTLVSGPVHLDKPQGVQLVPVVTAEDMFRTVMSAYREYDLIMKTAAVADYTPAHVHTEKIKKQKDRSFVIEMKRTKDILEHLGQAADKPFLVGFAAESTNVLQYARTKLKKKNLDLVVANSIAGPNSAFQSDENEVTMITEDMEKPLQRMSKQRVAEELIREIYQLMNKG